MRTAIFVIGAAVVIAGGFAAWRVARSGGDPLTRLATDIPRNIHGWNAVEPDEVYDDESIYDYIDGHAEVYLAYGMDRCLARRYEGTSGDSALVLDVFRLAAPADAFGVFTHDRDGIPVAVGNDALLRPGWISFWQDRFFVSLYAEIDTPEAMQALHELARRVAAALPTGGELPSVVRGLPSSGLDEKSIHFLHHELILATHIFVANHNLLDLGPQVDVVLASYVRNTASARLLVAHYPTADRAERAWQSVVAGLLPEAPEGRVLQLEDGTWARTAVEGRYLALVLDATDADLADALAIEALTQHHGGQGS